MRCFFPIAAIVWAMVVPAIAGEPSAEAVSAMEKLDGSFIAAHAVANKFNLASGDPIILLRDGEMILMRDGTEESTTVILPAYNTYKTFAHLPVAIYLMLAPAGGDKLDTRRVERLIDYRAKMDRVEETIEQIGLKPSTIERQKEMVALSKQFLDQVIERRQCSIDELYTFTRPILPLIEMNIADAARSQLDAMHRQVMAWKEEISSEQWSKLRVALKGPVLARKDELAKQYFERALHIEGEGTRMVFMEMYYPPTPMLTLLATRSVDQGISIAFFDDPDRMFRDVLADAATAYIKRLKFE